MMESTLQTRSDPVRRPRVSVVMPVFEVERFVGRALQSVLAQTLSDLEVVIVDDGSTDRSIDICRAFRDPRIRIRGQENRGLSGARNTGIRHARGELVALLDADDAWEPEKLARHVAHLDARPSVGVSFSPSYFIDAEGRRLPGRLAPRLRGLQFTDFLVGNPVGNGSAPVVRRAVFDDIEEPAPPGSGRASQVFDESLPRAEDVECWLRVLLRTSWEIEGIPGRWTAYRIHGQSLSAHFDGQLEAWSRVLDKLERLAPGRIVGQRERSMAHHMRLLARAAVRSGRPATARRLLRGALRLHPRLLVEDPVRSLGTGLAALWPAVARRGSGRGSPRRSIGRAASPVGERYAGTSRIGGRACTEW